VQNFALGTRSAPQLVHFAPTGLPHDVQNLAPGMSEAPHEHAPPAGLGGLPLPRHGRPIAHSQHPACSFGASCTHAAFGVALCAYSMFMASGCVPYED
jgi:hypothetical protein